MCKNNSSVGQHLFKATIKRRGVGIGRYSHLPGPGRKENNIMAGGRARQYGDHFAKRLSRDLVEQLAVFFGSISCFVFGCVLF